MADDMFTPIRRDPTEDEDQPRDDDRLEQLPDFERDEPTSVGGGLVSQGGTATELGTGMSDERRPLDEEGQVPSPRDDRSGADPDEVVPPPLTQQ